jgi:aryl-alcohol dehydrogenase-like predicted oxidoreductase
MTTTRTLGRSGITVSALGLGCWAIGGPLHDTTSQYGWGTTDDDESIRGIRRAYDLGVTFYDTASNYGAGHSERLLGKAVAGFRDQIVLASKWGHTFTEAPREATGTDASPEYLRSCLQGSLHRLGTDYIDLYQLHINDLSIPRALDLLPTLEALVTAGQIRAYAWSTDDPARAAAFAEAGAHCTAIQHDQSVLHDNADMIAVCEAAALASINRGPLAMGLLSGKYHDGRTVTATDVRSQPLEWMTYFRDGAGAPEWLDRVSAVRDALTADGRTLAQGALGWLWTRSDATIPIPGYRTVAQVEENARALELGPLPADQFAAVEKLLTEIR